MFNKAIEAKSKAALQSFTSICKIDTHCWKSQRPNKKKKTLKPYKEEKVKPDDS